MLEECGLAYNVIPVNINKGDQSTPEYDAINPNNKMPAIIDRDAPGGPLTLFESGAILQYLGEKTGELLPTDTAGKYRVLQWVYVKRWFEAVGARPAVQRGEDIKPRTS